MVYCLEFLSESVRSTPSPPAPQVFKTLSAASNMSSESQRPTVEVALARRLSHLEQLEAESIHIMREVVAEFQNPVMLYSIGKDSSVMVRLAMKAFHPAKLPF